MRMVRRGILLIIIALVILFLSPWKWPDLLTTEFNQLKIQRSVDGATPTNTFILKKNQVIELPLPNAIKPVRLFSNATISRKQMAMTTDPFRYGLRYELIDKQGAIIKAGEFYHHVNIPKQRLHFNGNSVWPAFYLDKSIIPAETKYTKLDLTPLQQVKSIRLQLIEQQSPIIDISLRTFQELEHSERVVEFLWERLSEDKRNWLARAHVYPHTLITKSEQNALLNTDLVPFTPLGLAGKDYNSRLLYRHTTQNLQHLPGTTQTPGLFVDSSLKATITTPYPTRYRFQVHIQDPTPASYQRDSRQQDKHKLASYLQVNHYGPGEKKPTTHWFTIDTSTKTIEQYFSTGLLEFISKTPLTIEVFETAEPNRRQTKHGKLVPLYQLSSGEPIDYLLAPSRDQLQPLRLDLRQFSNENKEPSIATSTARIRCEWLDEAGNTLQTHLLEPELTPSLYDRDPSEFPPLRVSEAKKYYLYIPKQVHRIRVIGPNNTWIAAYTRPRDLAHKRRIPQDLYPWQADELRQPRWFQMSPFEADRLLDQQRTKRIQVFSRPPTIAEHLASGEYLWQSYLPLKNVYPKHLVKPFQALGTIKDSARSVIYNPVQANENTRIEFIGKGLRHISPTLLYLRSTNKPESIKVFIDNQLIYKDWITGFDGKISLPPHQPGLHSVRIDTKLNLKRKHENPAWYINKSRTPSTTHPLLMDRSVSPISGRKLSFIIEKTDASIGRFGIRYFSSIKNQKDGLSLVLTEATRAIRPGVYLSATLPTEHFELQALSPQSKPIRLLNSSGQSVYEYPPLLFSLGADIPPGQYRIEIERNDPSNHRRSANEKINYLMLYQVTPGEFDRQEFFKEWTFDES